MEGTDSADILSRRYEQGKIEIKGDLQSKKKRRVAKRKRNAKKKSGRYQLARANW